MKLLFDFFPILLFFIAYKTAGIHTATIVAIVAAFAQTGLFWLKHRRFENTHLLTLGLIVVFGGATLLLHDEMFIKWKPTVLNGLFALAFLGSHFIGKQTLVQRILGKAVTLPGEIWRRLNIAWGVFFLGLGAANLFVVYNFTTDTWVNFKLFGMLGITLAFIAAQSVYIARFARPVDSKEEA